MTIVCSPERNKAVDGGQNFSALESFIHFLCLWIWNNETRRRTKFGGGGEFDAF